MKTRYMLSKSKIKDSQVCALSFYRNLNVPSNERVWDKETLFRFEQGRVVETIARNMFPGAVLQDKLKNADKVEMTKELIKTETSIFEAAFAKKNTIIQFDILNKNEDGSWDAIEIKSGGSFKDEYELDALVQFWIATKAGLKIRNFQVWFINTQSTGPSDYFAKKDVTELVLNNERKFWSAWKKALAIAKSKNEPTKETGHTCGADCLAFKEKQNELSQDTYSVVNLPNFRSSQKAIDKGILSVHDEAFAKEFKTYVAKNQLIMRSLTTRSLIVDRQGFMDAFAKWSFPLNFFDFETLTSAIPVMENQRPYEQKVFQFSNHTWDGSNDKMEHSVFLHDNTSCPESSLIDAILSVLEKNQGSIVSWNKTFEMTRISELGKRHPQFADRLTAINARFVDLKDLVKAFVYHPAFKGSFSLKAVSPTLLKEFGSYSDSLIKSGAEIASYYTEMITTKDLAKKELIFQALIKYCSYDTLNLFLVLKFLLNPAVKLSELVELNMPVLQPTQQKQASMINKVIDFLATAKRSLGLSNEKTKAA